MRIGLVADVPDDAVARRIENVMEGERQFDDAEPGAQMTAGDRDGADRLGAQLIGELAQVALGQGAQILRNVNSIEQRRFGNRHNIPFIPSGRVPSRAARVRTGLNHGVGYTRMAVGGNSWAKVRPGSERSGAVRRDGWGLRDRPRGATPPSRRQV